jgi:DNA topoisomerase-1
MSIAQRLYEGIDIGQDGPEGLITYMRTDSVRIELQAIDAVRTLILKEYGSHYLPKEAIEYATKKSAQDAHEAIRPTNTEYAPEKLKKFLSDEEFKLYQLIWRRYVASQMNPAVYDTLTCDIAASKGLGLRASGSVLKFDGFLIVYEEKTDELKDEELKLPPLKMAESLDLKKLLSDQVFTRPPPRFTEASLVKELERLGIGRPSTYVPIMNKIQSRDYTIKEKSALKPTELGRVIAKMLEDNFGVIMDVHFTAKMEDALEHVADDTYGWRTLLHDFWIDFEPLIKEAEKTAHVPKEMTDKMCPLCGKPLQKVWSRSKYFYGCSDYPQCSFTSSIEGLEFKKQEYNPQFDWDQTCPKCSASMVVRQGKFGVFLGCSHYPECTGIINVPGKEEACLGEMPACVAIGCDGKMTPRRSRFGKVFFSCSNYPECDVIVNDLADLEQKYPHHPKTPYVKKARFSKGTKQTAVKKVVASKKPGTSKKKGTKVKKTTPQKGVKLSKNLASLLGQKEASRPEATKLIWDYIKEHQLQNPTNKREIIPDKALAEALGQTTPFDMMKLAGLLSKQLET